MWTVNCGRCCKRHLPVSIKRHKGDAKKKNSTSLLMDGQRGHSDLICIEKIHRNKISKIKFYCSFFSFLEQSRNNLKYSNCCLMPQIYLNMNELGNHR